MAQNKNKLFKELLKIAKKIRKDTLTISYNANVGHIGSALSIVDILTVLYFAILNVDANKKYSKQRDRFILSKGHAAAALYSILFRKNFISKSALYTFCKNGGIFGVHPDYNLAYGIELTTGSLGNGIAVGAGMALSFKDSKENKIPRVYVLVSDAELNEGSVWESIMFAAHHNIYNLITIVDDNSQQAFGKTKDVLDIKPLENKWSSFGWNTLSIDGHDIGQIYNALQIAKNTKEKPTVIIAKTQLGKGVSFMEGKVDWHYLPVNKTLYKLALRKLD